MEHRILAHGRCPVSLLLALNRYFPTTKKIHNRGEKISGLRRQTQIQKVPGSNPTEFSTGFADPISLRVSR